LAANADSSLQCTKKAFSGPIAMLFWSAVINGVVAVPIMVAMMWMISSKAGARTV
jgi:hypothetical protein